MGKLVICPAGTFLGLSKETNGRGKIVLVAVEALSVESKSLAAVGVRISTDERHGFGAAALLSTRASSLEQGKAGGPVESAPKLVRHIWSGSTWFAEQPFPYFT